MKTTRLNVIDLLIMRYLLKFPIKAKTIVKRIFEGQHLHGNPRRRIKNDIKES